MTLLRWFSRLTWLGACLWLAGCETPLPEVLYPDLRFSHLPPIQLNVARIDVVDGYQSPLREPNVEHKLPLAPVLAMRNWARDRLRAVGSHGRARFVIQDASVIMEPLKKKNGLKALFTLRQAARFSARLAARLEVETAGGMGSGFAEAQVTRQRTTPETLSLNEREGVLYQFVEASAKDFDQVMAEKIRQHLGDFLR